MKTKLMIHLAALGLAVALNAAEITSDDFTYSDGDITTVSSGAWANFSGTTNPTISGGEVVVGAGAGDIEFDLGGDISSGTAFFGIDLNVSSAASSSDYVMGFRDGTSLVARLFLDGVTGGYDIGVNTGGASSSSAGDTAGLTLLENTTYRLVFSYDRVGTVNAWINPTIADLATPDASFTNADAHNPDAFYIRQGGGWDNGGASWTGDNLVISSDFATAIPEPSTILLVGLTGLAGFAAYRRRKNA